MAETFGSGSLGIGRLTLADDAGRRVAVLLEELLFELDLDPLAFGPDFEPLALAPVFLLLSLVSDAESWELLDLADVLFLAIGLLTLVLPDLEVFPSAGELAWRRSFR